MEATEPHWRAGKEFDLTNERVIAGILDHPTLARMNGLDPENVLAGWRMTGDKEAEARGGLIFCGETRSDQDIVRHYRTKTRWRRLWFAVFRPRELKPTW
jgi:hypothetical protein